MRDRPRTLAVLLVLALSAALGGCGVAEGGEADGRLSVVATMSILGALVEEVGGQWVRVEVLVPVGGDPHTYEPRPSDARRIADADLVVDNGLGLSPWFTPFAETAADRLVVPTDGLADRAARTGGALDPHMWMVPTLVADGYLPALAGALARLDPDHAGAFRARADAYARELTALDAELRQALATIPDDRRELVTSHDAYSYFAARYDLEVIGSPLGVSTEEAARARVFAALTDQIEEAEVPTIFVESSVNPALIEQVARETGVRIGAPLYGDSVGPPGSGAETYEGMLRANVAALVDGLAP